MRGAIDWTGVFWADAPLLVLDTETTGFGRNDRICSISLMLMQGETVMREYHRLINPGFSIPADSTRIHGIDDDDVADAPMFHEVHDVVLDFLTADAPWVAHGMAFDTRMLSYDIAAEDWPEGVATLCTLDYARYRNAVTKRLRKHKLVDLANYFEVMYDPAQLHSSAYDTKVLAAVTHKLMGRRTIPETMTRWSEEWRK